MSGGTSFARVSAGGRHACAVTPGGALRCWGDNAAGQLGTGGAGGSSATPVAVPGPGDGSSWADVAAGNTHTCAVTTTGRAYCWGDNGTGQLGDGGTQSRGAPAAVDTELRFTTVGVGQGYSCGVATSGIVYCWGTGGNAKLGNGDTGFAVVTRPTPVRAP